MTIEQYWKIRALVSDCEAFAQSANATLRAKEQIRDAAIRDAGLDPSKAYTLNDEDCTAVLKESAK